MPHGMYVQGLVSILKNVLEVNNTTIAHQSNLRASGEIIQFKNNILPLAQ